MPCSGSIIRGDGTHWRYVQTLKSDDGNPLHLWKLKARAENDVWAIAEMTTALRQGLLFHWDGLNFKQVPVPGAGKVTRFAAIAPISATDAWLAGNDDSSTTTHFWRWNGSTLLPYTLPPRTDPGVFATSINGVEINDIVALSSTDAWAVGTTTSGSLALHWDGTQWTIQNGSHEMLYIGQAWDIAAIAHNDVWVTGQHEAIHWDGTDWRTPPLLGFEWGGPNGSVAFFDIAASSSNNVWTVGYGWTDGPHPFAAHWDGTQWTILPNSNRVNFGELRALVVLPNKLWTFGTAYQDEDYGPVYSTTAQFTHSPCPAPHN